MLEEQGTGDDFWTNDCLRPDVVFMVGLTLPLPSGWLTSAPRMDNQGVSSRGWSAEDCWEIDEAAEGLVIQLCSGPATPCPELQGCLGRKVPSRGCRVEGASHNWGARCHLMCPLGVHSCPPDDPSETCEPSLDGRLIYLGYYRS